MAGKDKPSPNLKTPHGVGPQGPAVDLAEAALMATAALPEYLSIRDEKGEVEATIADILDDIARSLQVIATYIQRKGKEEGVFSPEEEFDQNESEDD